MDELFKKFQDFIEKYKIIEKVLILGVFLTTVLAIYLSSFSMNIFILIDSSMIGTFIENIIFYYVLSTILVTISFTLIKKGILGTGSKEINELFEDKKLYITIIKYLLSLIIFMFLYIGIKNTLYGLLILLFTYLILLMFEFMRESQVNAINNKPNQDKALDKIVDDKQYLHIIITQLKIFIIVIAIFLGIFRAEYVKKHSIVKVNHKESKLSLFITTNYGINLYDEANDNVIFISWDNIKDMKFLDENKSMFYY